jgi:general secretion pathway protein D
MYNMASSTEKRLRPWARTLCCLLIVALPASAQTTPPVAPVDLVTPPPAELPADPAAAAAPAAATPGHGPALGSTGRLIPLSRIPETQIRELISDLAGYFETQQNLYRLAGPANPSSVPPAPERVRGLINLAADSAPTVPALRLGYVTMPRRIPQLWVDGPSASLFDEGLRKVLEERAQTRSNLRLRELESQIIHLSYIDANDALFALRAMGYSAITDENSPLTDEAASPELPEVPGYGPANGGMGGGGAVSMTNGTQGFSGGAGAAFSSNDQSVSKFKSLKNLPKSIGMDKLPLVIRMPNPERKEVGLVGGTEGTSNQIQRDQLGMTNILPNAASDLSQTVANGTNELLVMYHPDSPEQFQRLRHLVETTIDRPARQVYIEGLVLEINSDTLRDLGVQWSAKRGSYGLTLGTLTAGATSALSASRNSLQAVSPMEVLNRINALIEVNKAEVLSRPSVMTIDNRQATIRVGTDIPIATSIDSGNGAAGGRVSFNFQYIPTGILLNVRPRVNEDGSEVSMLIDASVSAAVPNQDLKVLDATNGAVLASAPTISTRRVQTYARIRDNMPLIIGGLVSRNNSTSSDKVPGIGEVPMLGKLFGHESKVDNKREVIVVLTPSVVTEDAHQTKAQYPKDDARFDLNDTTLTREHFRIQAEDIVDAQFILGNPRFAKYQDLVRQLIRRQPGLAQQLPYSAFAGEHVPAEFIFVSGLIDRLLTRHKEAGDNLDINRMVFFEGLRGADFHPQSLGGLMASMGDGKDPLSFFSRNKGRALALTFRPLGGSVHDMSDMFAEPVPEISLVDCPDRATWRRKLWELNHPASGTRFTILIHDESDLARVRLALALKNTIMVNGKEPAITFNNFQPGRMVQIQRSQPNWDQSLEGSVARNFFIGEYFYPYFIEEHERMLRELDAALRQPEMKPYLDGLALP